MSRMLPTGARRVRGWERQYLTALENGYSERYAMRAAGVGPKQVSNHAEKDEEFRNRQEVARATGESRGGRRVGGLVG